MSDYDTLISRVLHEVVNDNFTVFDTLASENPVALAHLQAAIGERLDEATEAKGRLQRAFDRIRLGLLPEAMAALDGGVRTINVEGLGRIGLTSDMYVSVLSADQQRLQVWLVENNFEDLIKETVNSSTLKAWAVKRFKEGKEIPEFVKLTPFTRATITKV